MKRVAVSVVLIVMVVAAAVAVDQLFKQPSSSQSEITWPAQRGPASAIPAPANMTTFQIATLLAEWTYPGAKDTTGQFTLPRTKMDAQAKMLTMFACRFAIYEPPAKVRRFYADKLKVDPNASAAFAGVPMRTPEIGDYANAIQDAITPRPPIGMGNGGFTLSTDDYLIRAVVANKAGQKPTVVTLLLFPYKAVEPPSCKPHVKQADEALALRTDKKRRSGRQLL